MINSGEENERLLASTTIICMHKKVTWWKVTTAYHRVYDQVTCGLTVKKLVVVVTV